MIVGYCRVSGIGQVEGEGLPRQRDAIQRAAVLHGLAVEQVFEEHGVSGTTDWMDRPAWIQMMSLLESGDTIIIERLDRLARDLGVQEHVIRDLKKRDVALISEAEPDLGSTDPTRILFRQILGAIAQFDRAQIEAKLRHARERIRSKEGRCEGRKPYGRHPERPEERPWLEQIVQLSRSGFTTREIANQLNISNAPTRKGSVWRHGTVAKIITANAETAGSASLRGVAAVPPSVECAPGAHSDPAPS